MIRLAVRLALVIMIACLLRTGVHAIAGPGDWPYWRGPHADGMAVGDAPLKWSDTENVRWKIDIPGLGNSSPVISGDQIFLTTAIPTGAAPAAAAPPPPPPPATGGRRMGLGSSGPL